MALGNEGKLLAASLTALKQVTDKNNSTIIESDEISRTHRERLEAAGFLEPIMQGWYAFAKPGGNRRVETAWGSAYWEFVSRYLAKRFGDDYWLNPVGSIRLHAENYSVPSQLMICVPGPINGQVPSRPNTLPGGATLYISGNSPVPSSIAVKSNLRLMSPEAAIANLPVGAWAHMPTDAVSVLGSIPGSNLLLRAILDGGMITRAGAAAGALRHIGRSADADRIISTISGLGHGIREEDPLSDQQNLPTFNSRKPLSAAGTRIKLLWSKMRDDVLAEFVEKPRRVTDIPRYLAEIDDRYVSDAYNSLSIEGYKVTAELIEKVQSKNWKPETNASDFETHNALAAQGYWLAFNEVKKDVKNILEGADVSSLLWDRHQEWFKAMFQPFVTIGQQEAHTLAGYRNGNVFIIGSDHVPYSPEAVLDGMDALFDCIAEEEDPRVKAVLGPYIFTFIHPYMDGNGRNARFLMNALLAEGGFPWTVIPVDRRSEYMACLEAASKHENIKPLAAFVAELVASPPPPRPKETAWSKRKENGPEAATPTNDEPSDDSSGPKFRVDVDRHTTISERASIGEASDLKEIKPTNLIGRVREFGLALLSGLNATNDEMIMSPSTSRSGAERIVGALGAIIAPVLNQHLVEIRAFRRGGGSDGQRWEGYRTVFETLQTELDGRHLRGGHLLHLAVQQQLDRLGTIEKPEANLLSHVVRKAIAEPLDSRLVLKSMATYPLEDAEAVVADLRRQLDLASEKLAASASDYSHSTQQGKTLKERVLEFKDKVAPKATFDTGMELKPRF